MAAENKHLFNSTFLRPIDDELSDYLRDESRKKGSAEAIAFCTEEVQVISLLKYAAKSHTLVTIQGGRTGVTAGAVPDEGYILNLSRMKRICGLRWDAFLERYFLLVQPGVVLKDLREQLEGKTFNTALWDSSSCDALSRFSMAGEWFFPADPTEASATIGGMVSCNASGARSFHYGPTGKHVEAIRVVFSNGEAAWVRRGIHKVLEGRFCLSCDSGFLFEGSIPDYPIPNGKCAAGYNVSQSMDLIDLFIGMEGTLAVITQIELRLEPVPAFLWGVMMFLPTQASAVALVEKVRETLGLTYSVSAHAVAIEFFNADALAFLRHQKDSNPAFADIPVLPDNSVSALYVELIGDTQKVVEDGVGSLSEWLEDVGGDDATAWCADTPRDIEKFKYFRHALPEAVNLVIDQRRKQYPSLTKLGTDMAAPDSCLEWIMNMYDDGLKSENLESVIFGHIGNNHMHVNILPRNPQEYEKGKKLYLGWAQEIVAKGGTVSAEHGIGKLKRDFLELMYGHEVLGKMKAIKSLFDSQGILNNGNLFVSSHDSMTKLDSISPLGLPC